MEVTEERRIRRIVRELYSPPLFELPRASTGHTRHYMPWDKKWREQRHAAKTLVFDTFVVVPKEQPVIAYWPGATLGDERPLLSDLLTNLPYLGRSESWCNAKLRQESEVPENLEEHLNSDKIIACKPIAHFPAREEGEVVNVLVPRQDIDPSLPLNEEHPLLVRTTTLREEMGRIDPPGARWIQYTRPRNCLQPRPAKGKSRPVQQPVKLVRYHLDGNVLPPITEALSVSAKSRAAAMSVYGGPSKRRSTVLSGKDTEGQPLTGHRHTYYISSDEDADGRIDHLTLYASMGFNREHQKALRKLNKLYGRGDRPNLNLLLLGMAESPRNWPDNTLFGPSRKWVSATPYLLTRHPKTRSSGRWKTKPIPEKLEIRAPKNVGRFPTPDHLFLEYGVIRSSRRMQQDGPLAQLLLDLNRRGLPKATTIDPLPYHPGPGTQRWLEFKRYRRGGPEPAVGIPFGFTIEFPKTITGPIALGYNAHLGLGLFVPQEKDR